MFWAVSRSILTEVDVLGSILTEVDVLGSIVTEVDVLGSILTVDDAPQCTNLHIADCSL